MLNTEWTWAVYSWPSCVPVAWSQEGAPEETVQPQGAVWSPADQAGVCSPASEAVYNHSPVGGDSLLEVACNQWMEDAGSQVWHPVWL